MNFLLLAIQSTVCVLCVALCKQLGVISYAAFDKEAARKWFPISFLLVCVRDLLCPSQHPPHHQPSSLPEPFVEFAANAEPSFNACRSFTPDQKRSSSFPSPSSEFD